MTNTWWMPTSKGIKRGIPADERFAVVGMRDGYMLAWKCRCLEGDSRRMWHPAFGNCTGTDEGWVQDSTGIAIDPFCLKGENGSEPTALFKPDSLYCMCV